MERSSCQIDLKCLHFDSRSRLELSSSDCRICKSNTPNCHFELTSKTSTIKTRKLSFSAFLLFLSTVLLLNVICQEDTEYKTLLIKPTLIRGCCVSSKQDYFFSFFVNGFDSMSALVCNASLCPSFSFDSLIVLGGWILCTHNNDWRSFYFKIANDFCICVFNPLKTLGFECFVWLYCHHKLNKQKYFCFKKFTLNF